MTDKWTISKEGRFWQITDENGDVRFRGKNTNIILTHFSCALQQIDYLQKCKNMASKLVDAIKTCDDDLIDKIAGECDQMLAEPDPEIEIEIDEEEE